MNVQPGTIGNADPDWPPQYFNEGFGGRPRLVLVQPIETYPNPPPKRCVWALLLLCCLLVLRMQQDKYAADGLDYDDSTGDDGPPFPWEVHPLYSGGANETLQATFLSPDVPRASSFLHSQDLLSVVLSGSNSLVVDRDNQQPDASALVRLSSAPSLMPLLCPGDKSEMCYLGVQRLLRVKGKGHVIANSTCYGLLAGPTPSALRPLAGAGHAAASFCLETGSNLLSVVPFSDTSALISWAVPARASHQSSASHDVSPEAKEDAETGSAARTCLAVVELTSLAVTMAVEINTLVLTARFDEASASVVVVSYLGSQLNVLTLNPSTLQPMWRYRLPLKVGWLLQSSVVPSGEVLLVGCEEKLRGTIIAVDLKQRHVYRQDAPGLTGTPARQKLLEAVEPGAASVKVIDSTANGCCKIHTQPPPGRSSEDAANPSSNPAVKPPDR